MELLSAWLSMLLAGRFIVAFIAHVREPQRFRDVLMSLGLPQGLERPMRVVDVAVALSLIAAPKVGAILALAYIGVATVLMAWRIGAGARIRDCGCDLEADEVGPAFFLRNAGLAAGASVVLLARHALPMEVTWWGALALFSGHELIQRQIRALVRHRRAAFSAPTPARSVPA
jgi:hypothetical protein